MQINKNEDFFLKKLGAPPLLAISRQPRGIAAQFPLDRFAVFWELRSQDIAELSNLRLGVLRALCYFAIAARGQRLRSNPLRA